MNDYIKRKDIYDHIVALYKTANICGFVVTGDMVLKSIEYAVAEDVKPVVHGTWCNVYLSSPSSFVGTCSVCGQSNDIPPPILANFCPNCGADMRINDGNE